MLKKGVKSSLKPTTPVCVCTGRLFTPGKAAAFCLIIFFMYLCTLKKGCESWNIDTFYYLTLAKSLISLEGFKILGTPYTKYPFGFPCLLAPIVGIVGYNFLFIQLFMVIIAIFALYTTFIFFKRFSKERIAETAFLLTGVSYFFWAFSCNYIVSETPYLLFSLLTLIMAQKSLKEHNNVIRNSVLLSLLILASYFIRMVGIALLAAVCIFACKSLIKKHKDASACANADRLKRLCTILLICGIAISAWYVREKLLPTVETSVSYGEEFVMRTTEAGQPLPSFVFSIIKRNLVNNITHIASLVTSIPQFPQNLRFWGYFISLLFALGFLHSLIKNSTVVEWYLAFYIGIHLLWPYDYVRFWYPAIPFVFFYLLKALSLIKENIFTALPVQTQTGTGTDTKRKAIFFALLFCGFFLVYIPLTETQYYQNGLMGRYQMLITIVFVMLYFLMLSTSFIFAFLSKKDNTEGIANSQEGMRLYLWKIAFAIIVFHNLSMIAYRTHLKHQDYGLRWADKLYFQEMGQWLRQNSDKNDVVMCEDKKTNVALGVFSERNCTPYPEALDVQSITDKFQKENVRYILVENNKKSHLKNLRDLEAFSMLNFRKILQVEGNQLFKIEPRKS